MSQDAVRYALDENIAVLTLDDGKANALSHAVIDALAEGLDRAAKDEARAILLAGRPGRFCAGFDLKVMRQGLGEAGALVLDGADLAARLFDWPVPVVLAVTGHALAMGAVLCLAADERIGADGDFKIGLNEVAIGMTLPDFAVELARERLSRRHLGRAVAQAEIYTPGTAADAGFLDRVVPPEQVVSEALARAKALAAGLDLAAHAATKRALRAGTRERLRASLERDRARLENA